MPRRNGRTNIAEFALCYVGGAEWQIRALNPISRAALSRYRLFSTRMKLYRGCDKYRIFLRIPDDQFFECLFANYSRAWKMFAKLIETEIMDFSGSSDYANSPAS